MPLWLLATPIGTLGDLSPRAKEVLSHASLIAAEDTRTTRRLLSAVEIGAPELVSLHAHNEEHRAAEIASLAAHKDVVLVSDAGTPAISDPGARVVAEAHRLQVRVLSVPGPSAVATALAASGFPSIPSTFLGFPPRKGRDEWARSALERPETLVLFEAPTRVADLAARLAQHEPSREACLCRELSKLHEEALRASLGVLAEDLARRTSLRGECVLVVGPGRAAVRRESEDLPEGAGLKQIAALLAARWGIPRPEMYRRLHALREELVKPSEE